MTKDEIKTIEKAKAKLDEFANNGDGFGIINLIVGLNEIVRKYSSPKEEIDEKAAYRAKVEQANREGKTIQYKLSDEWVDRHPESKGSPLDWDICDYRIKPQPKIIPWTVHTIPKGEPLRFKDWSGGMCFIAITYMQHGFLYFNPDHLMTYRTYSYLLKNGERLDGSPCGEDV
jgi:hypothetical protein